MTRAIVDYKAFGIYTDEPVTVRASQLYYLSYTQASSDLTMDLANTSGTFWAEADDTALGLAAKNALASIIAKALARISWSIPAIDDKVKIAASGTLAATSEYKITTTSIVPSFLFFTAGAPTTVKFMLVCLLADQERAVRAGSL